MACKILNYTNFAFQFIYFPKNINTCILVNNRTQYRDKGTIYMPGDYKITQLFCRQRNVEITPANFHASKS